MTYLDKLRSPLWQKKRLEILNRDKFTCQNCFSKEKELQIHHLLYQKGKEPWEVDSEYLKTVCSDCHKEEQKVKFRMDQFWSLIPCSEKKRFLGLLEDRIKEGFHPCAVIMALIYILRAKDSVSVFYGTEGDVRTLCNYQLKDLQEDEMREGQK